MNWRDTLRSGVKWYASASQMKIRVIFEVMNTT